MSQSSSFCTHCRIKWPPVETTTPWWTGLFWASHYKHTYQLINQSINMLLFEWMKLFLIEMIEMFGTVEKLKQMMSEIKYDETQVFLESWYLFTCPGQYNITRLSI